MILSVSNSQNAEVFGEAEDAVMVDMCDIDVDFGGLAVGVSRGDALAERPKAGLPGLGAAPVFSRPLAVGYGAVARGISLRALEAVQSTFHGRRFFRNWIIAMTPFTIE